jgi:eukaryotic-like serine/threonine-protein kinase
MALSPGTRLGPYEILSALGAGGMGEVYRATDTTLGRDVAIKTLPDGFALDLERVARFKREAQVLAALNHPHIAAIYGLEEVNGGQFLVLELVEGDTLAQRIATGLFQSPRRCGWHASWPTPSRPRTRRASSTGISSPPISRSPTRAR